MAELKEGEEPYHDFPDEYRDITAGDTVRWSDNHYTFDEPHEHEAEIVRVMDDDFWDRILFYVETEDSRHPDRRGKLRLSVPNFNAESGYTGDVNNFHVVEEDG